MSIFLLTYTYIEAKSNYHRGSILILRYATTSLSCCLLTYVTCSYVVLIAGFYFAPPTEESVVSNPEGLFTSFAPASVLAASSPSGPSAMQTVYTHLRSLWP